MLISIGRTDSQPLLARQRKMTIFIIVGETVLKIKTVKATSSPENTTAVPCRSLCSARLSKPHRTRPERPPAASTELRPRHTYPFTKDVTTAAIHRGAPSKSLPCHASPTSASAAHGNVTACVVERDTAMITEGASRLDSRASNVRDNECVC